MIKIAKRLWDSPTFTTWASLGTQSVSLVIVLPLVLTKLSAEEIALYYLFATAIGLAAAIPAYIAYNKFSIDAGKFAGRLDAFADDLQAAVARRLGSSATPPAPTAPSSGINLNRSV